MRYRATFVLFLLTTFISQAQPRTQPDAARIKLEMKKLNVLGTVLYLAAHPDDENTRAIAYLSNDRLVTTGYLAMTRGDGGQNLIGPEIRDLLGLIRTQELLAARRIDGGQQFFTRANDFGFSKSADEALKIWGKQEILSDVVKVIRQFQPDVILTRFPPDERAGHGHHTASAILAQEAFDITNDKSAFPEQLKELSVWQPKRLYTNTGRWWNQSITADTPGVVTMDVGAYSPLLGTSYSEMAAVSRTQHKSQGFGSSGHRGSSLEFFEYVKGDKAEKDILDGINLSWSRVPGGASIEPMVASMIEKFDAEHPEASVPSLLKVRSAISGLPANIWRTRKLAEVDQLIQDCLGLYVSVAADQYWVSPGEQVKCSFEVVSRAPANLSINKITSPQLMFDSTLNTTLTPNQTLEFKSNRTLPSTAAYSDPYWLSAPHSIGRFTVKDPHNIGKPENDPAVLFDINFLIEGQPVTLHVPLAYTWTDPVKGEMWRPFAIVPPVTMNITDHVLIFNDASPKSIAITLKSNSGKEAAGELQLKLPEGWKATPTSVPFQLTRRGEEKAVNFTIHPSAEEMTATLSVVANMNNQSYDQSIQTIDYDHIPIQTLLPTAEARLVRINLKKEGGVVGYVKGAGDEIPAALRNMGYEVWEMNNDEVTPENLKRLDAVVLGVRALNTNDRVKFFMPALLDYVKSGGTLVVQYNNNYGLEIEPDKFSPYPLTISRDRVTEEDSEIRLLAPSSSALNYPNKITAKDFEGWVQERGLYFPNKWDDHFQAVLSSNDTGETPKDGALLVASYGEGHYIYTGLSFFRELPEGVPGAYKLFANLVSMGQTKKLQTQKLKSGKK